MKHFSIYLFIHRFWNIFVFDFPFVVGSMFTQITPYINVAVASWLDTTNNIYLNTVSGYLLSIMYIVNTVDKFSLDFLNNLLKWRCRLHQMYIIIPINIVVFENDELGKALICWKTKNEENTIESRNMDTQYQLTKVTKVIVIKVCETICNTIFHTNIAMCYLLLLKFYP